MIKKQPPTITYKGRSLGILILVISQLIIGAIHAFFGLLLLAYENLSFLPTTAVYDVYTFIFGILVLVFAVFIWQGKKVGWIGTVAVSLFVIAADSLTLLDLPSIPGIPKFAGFTEIAYSVLVLGYLLQTRIRKKYCGTKKI
jgi:heme A synthase